MTTPPLVGPPPAIRPLNRRIAVAASALVLVVGGATAWWLTQDDDGSGSPLAGRPRVTDDAAGISYAIPEGWERNEEGDLVDAFTSSVTVKRANGEYGEEGAGVVLAGRGGGVPTSALKQRTETVARSNAEYFYPDGSSTLEESRAITVSDRPAHTVALKVRDSEGGPVHLRLTLIATEDSRSAFLLGIAQPDGPAERQEVDEVLESASVG